MIVGLVDGCRFAGSRIGQQLEDQWRPYVVMDAEPGYPDQLTRWELDDAPSSFVPEAVIVPAGGPDVAVPGGAAARPFLDVVAVGAVRGGAAARVRAGPVPDLGTTPQRLAGAAGATLVMLAGVPVLGGRTVGSPIAVTSGHAFIGVAGLLVPVGLAG